MKFQQKGSFKSKCIKADISSKFARMSGLAVSLLVAGTPAFATDFTAGVVLSKMEGKERYAFVAGIVEGLAIAWPAPIWWPGFEVRAVADRSESVGVP